MDWYLKALKQYATFAGRARRAEYWWFALIYLLIAIVLAIADGIAGTDRQFGGNGLLGTLFVLAMLLPSIALGVRRLHDTDRSGWWLLIGLLPLIGFIVLLVWAAQRGTAGANRYGADPLAEPA